MVLVAVGVNLLPDVIVPPPGGELRLARWSRLYLEPVATGSRPPGVWASDPLYNQSIPGLVARLGAPAEAVTATTAVLLAVLIVGAIATVRSSGSPSEAEGEVPSRDALVYGLVRFRVPAEVSIVVLAAVAIDRVVARLRPGSSPVRTVDCPPETAGDRLASSSTGAPFS